MNPQDEVLQCYARARVSAPPGAPVMALHIGEQCTEVAAGRGAHPAATLRLDIGARKTATEFLHHSPPTPLEMEYSIAAVEDEVMRALPLREAGAELVCQDAWVAGISRLSGVPPGSSATLSLDAMERTFLRLAAVSEGRPIAQDGLPDKPEFAATLLILREFMHHLRFASLTVVDAAGQAAAGESSSAA
ncbi:MAG: hypothetical protein Q7T63_12860 [Burkholderiaceae bacterium]|nr:hypothetical protein [Burkholderiaceae bacterium]